ncbi:hypothetical protein F5Y16DRAFT_340443 [Xylariaceae sp. FL0255]|nr:hypothetical protein F5Y16DRAFT_340443 [Xylariaceae sp. FL0255]
MADPLLTSLCTICHIQTPKYTCPRCATRTCSLACVKKHKTWSSCNGERDATAYVPREKLKTDAGIDHDYNFLSSIERSLERADRIQRVDRGILPEEDDKPPPAKRARFNKGQSRGRTTVDEGSRKWDRNTIHRLRQLGMHVSSMPYGMSRAKENQTSWNKRTRTINWQVEWVIFESNTPTASSGSSKSTRVLHKALDQTPLHIAFADALEYHRMREMKEGQRQEEKKRRRQQQYVAQRPQDASTSRWHSAAYPVQCQTTSAWLEPSDNIIQHNAQNYRFFFLKPKTPSREAQRLVPLDAKDGLATVLPGQEIVEFPTIYAIPASVDSIGEGYVFETVARQASSTKKRKVPTLVEYRSSAGSSSGSDGEEDEEEEEEGEIIEQDDVEDTDDETSSSGSDSDM